MPAPSGDPNLGDTRRPLCRRIVEAGHRDGQFEIGAGKGARGVRSWVQSSQDPKSLPSAMVWALIGQPMEPSSRLPAFAARHGVFLAGLAVCGALFAWMVTDGTWRLALSRVFGNFFDYQARSSSCAGKRLDIAGGGDLASRTFTAHGKCYGYFGLTPADASPSPGGRGIRLRPGQSVGDAGLFPRLSRPGPASVAAFQPPHRGSGRAASLGRGRAAPQRRTRVDLFFPRQPRHVAWQSHPLRSNRGLRWRFMPRFGTCGGSPMGRCRSGGRSACRPCAPAHRAVLPGLYLLRAVWVERVRNNALHPRWLGPRNRTRILAEALRPELQLRRISEIPGSASRPGACRSATRSDTRRRAGWWALTARSLLPGSCPL